MARIHLPTPLRPFADGAASVEVAGATVAAALEELVARHPPLRKHLYDDAGKVRSFVNLYKNDEDVRYLEKEATRLADGDSLSIVPSIAGGAEDLSNEEIRRVLFRSIMPEVGIEGQRKLKAARVLAIGAGGLGSPLAVYLAAAGVGTIGIVDNDVVDDSNLQRQILYGASDIGRPKLQAAAERLRDMNPNVEVVPYETRLDSSNALEIFREYDVIADGTDNFPTRYLVNDACVLTGKPNVYASIYRFEGQASVFWAEKGPCYRCLYTEPPPPGLVPSCAEGGVLGILPGLLGVIQATETIKLVLGSGDSLIGRLLLVDALAMRFRELRLRKNPDCVVCGKNPSVTKLIDYEEFCGLRGQEAPVSTTGVPEISVEELKRRLDAKDDLFILDVREPHEYQICNLNGHLIPLNDLPKRVNELDPSKDMVVHCRSGGRSAKAVEFLRQAGFTKAKNLTGGVLAWADKIDPKMPKY